MRVLVTGAEERLDHGQQRRFELAARWMAPKQ